MQMIYVINSIIAYKLSLCNTRSISQFSIEINDNIEIYSTAAYTVFRKVLSGQSRSWYDRGTIGFNFCCRDNGRI